VLQSLDLSLAPAYGVALVVGYLCGSIPSGLILTLLVGRRDIRSIGSGNVVATSRKWLAVATLLGDALKGTGRGAAGEFVLRPRLLSISRTSLHCPPRLWRSSGPPCSRSGPASRATTASPHISAFCWRSLGQRRSCSARSGSQWRCYLLPLARRADR
jgi:hypothetical protein